MAKKKDIVSKLAVLLIDMTRSNQILWKVGEMNQKTGDFRAEHKDYYFNLEGIYTVPKENYFRFRLIPKTLLGRFDKEIGFRSYRVSSEKQPEAYSMVKRLADMIRTQLDERLLADLTAFAKC